MTATDSATVGASNGGRATSSAPGGLPFFIETWSESGRPWNSATAMDSLNIPEFPNFFGRFKSGCAVRGWVSDSSSDWSCGALFFTWPNIPSYSFALGGRNPYSAYLRNMHPVPTYTGPWSPSSARMLPVLQQRIIVQQFSLGVKQKWNVNSGKSIILPSKKTKLWFAYRSEGSIPSNLCGNWM